MFDQFRSGILWCALLFLLIAQGACTAAAPPKVECDSNLRPINPTTLEHQKQ
jgi:hypothetical protein